MIKAVIGLILIGFLLAGVSAQSLWIDEGDTAYYAIQPSAGEWWKHLKTDPNADCQFPLAMALTWVWSRLFGTSEYALRSINVVFSLITIGGFAISGRLLRIRWLWIAPLLQPFFWFYLNEARPYSLQMAAGATVMAGFIAVTIEGNRLQSWCLFLFGSIILFYSTLLSFVTLAAYLAAIGILLSRSHARLPRHWPFLVLVGAIAVFPGCLYYLETVHRGAGGARIWEVSPLNFAWVGYELVGAVGLGPGIAEIRETARAVLSGPMPMQTALLFVFPAILGGLVGLIFLLGWSRIRRQSTRLSIFVYLAGVLLFVVVSFALLSIALHKAFWARHLSPVFPIYACLFYICLSACFRNTAGWHAWQRCIAATCMLGMLASILIQRFGVHHQKDGYREAAAMAQAGLRRGETIWWAGSLHCAAYYGLPTSNKFSFSPKFQLLSSPNETALATLAPPNIVLLSRPDIYDGNGTIRRQVHDENWQPAPQHPYLFSAWIGR